MPWIGKAIVANGRQLCHDRKIETNKPKAPIKTEMKKVVNTWVQTTSVKGLSKAAKSDDHCTRILWIVGTLAGLGIALNLLYTLTSDYLKFETIIQIEKCSTCRPDFPDITVCNLNVLASLAAVGVTYESYMTTIHRILSSNHNLTAKQLGVLKEMYSTSAYFDNIDLDPIYDFLDAPGGINVFVHDCAW